jgi:putative DNA methylase
MVNYPKRLIEVDLPIARISAHARREKSIRHGHISTLHIWWARRPLAACRAVICAALWPDPADENCPQAFRDAAARRIIDFARRADGDMKLLATSSEEGKARWAALVKRGFTAEDAKSAEGEHLTSSASLRVLRGALLDFIADFANWDNSTVPDYLETSRALTQAAHEALGGEPGTRPLVVDPFAGGGSIPLEALRVGADAFASDINPVAILLNRVVLEYIPRCGQQLADDVRKWGAWVKDQAEKELSKLYPKSADKAAPIAYLWARTIQCEGPGCGAEVPLIRSLWLAKKGNRSVALRLVPHAKAKRVDFEIVRNPTAKDIGGGTVQRGSATCPICGYTTPVACVRQQLSARKGGTADARLYCTVVRTSVGETEYRIPNDKDLTAIGASRKVLQSLNNAGWIIPAMNLPPDGALGFRVQKYGILEWRDLFTPRQQAVLATYAKLVSSLPMDDIGEDARHTLAALLGLTAAKMASFASSLCVWRNVRTCVAQTFGRQTLSMVWDFGEMNPFAESAGDFGEGTTYLAELVEHVVETTGRSGEAQEADAAKSPLPDDLADLFFTDPPYYDSIPYNHLSEFFSLWLGMMKLVSVDASHNEARRNNECIVDEGLGKGRTFYEAKMTSSMREGRRIAKPSALGVVVFAHKSTGGWEAQLKSMIDAGWTMTGSWPIDTERSGRLRAHESAALASSVHLVCRPRETPNGAIREDVGEWRDVLAELPKRIHEWMPRLAEEGVVGADAIFACLGPALEVFSRYSRVEKASGDTATLQEYLEHVWAAVSTEALSMIFEDADAAGLEPDARLTAMWLWTLGGGKSGTNGDKLTAEDAESAEEEASDEEDDSPRSSAPSAVKSGYVLEFDAARKIAQGLGIHLEKSESIVEVKGDKARLLPVAERTQYLFGKGSENGKPSPRPSPKGRGRRAKQKTFFEELDEAQAADAGWGELKGPPPGSTVLDRLHQAMILFAAGRGELLKRFLVEEGIGTDARFWKLAQSFSALYPRGSEEKRWVDGVLARKKGLGL